MKKPKNAPKPAAPASPAGSIPKPDAIQTPHQIEHIERLAHELNNLLDGSIRNVGLARRALEKPDQPGATGVEDIKKRLDTAVFALERMADLVHASMQGGGQPLGSPLLAQAKPITLAEAAQHAIEVLRPEAQECRVALAVEIDPQAADLPAGPLYPVLLNGVRNSLEAVGRCGGIGRVTIQVRRGHAPDPARTTRRWVEIDIIDDGEGPPDDVPANTVFAAGFTTKKTGSGIGLAVSRDLVVQAGGTIELRRRADRSDARRPGALLRIRVPESQGGPDQIIGGQTPAL